MEKFVPNNLFFQLLHEMSIWLCTKCSVVTGAQIGSFSEGKVQDYASAVITLA